MEKVPTIEIDMAKKCKYCGRQGVGPTGLCLTCVGKILKKKAKEKTMEKIGDKTIGQVVESVEYFLRLYQKQLNEAWSMLGDEPLKITISVALKPTDRPGEVDITTQIGFIKDRVKDQVKNKVNESQGELFGGEENS